jgi:hypothetical protein
VRRARDYSSGELSEHVDGLQIHGASADDSFVEASDRLTELVARTREVIVRADSAVPPGIDAITTPEYQRIVGLKVALEMETARVMSGAARLGGELAAAAEMLGREAERL